MDHIHIGLVVGVRRIRIALVVEGVRSSLLRVELEEVDMHLEDIEDLEDHDHCSNPYLTFSTSRMDW